ncbi:hypothetical protein LguiB_028115 [Lonicera macranthoides]
MAFISDDRAHTPSTDRTAPPEHAEQHSASLSLDKNHDESADQGLFSHLGQYPQDSTLPSLEPTLPKATRHLDTLHNRDTRQLDTLHNKDTHHLGTLHQGYPPADYPGQSAPGHSGLDTPLTCFSSYDCVEKQLARNFWIFLTS